MSGCFGDSAEDQWKQKQTMGNDDNDEDPVCTKCLAPLGPADECENKECVMYELDQEV